MAGTVGADWSSDLGVRPYCDTRPRSDGPIDQDEYAAGHADGHADKAD
jgi:hypothetical protein